MSAPAASAPVQPAAAPGPPTKRSQELGLLAFAAVVVTAALVLVELNQEQELSLSLIHI